MQYYHFDNITDDAINIYINKSVVNNYNNQIYFSMKQRRNFQLLILQ